EPPPPPPLDPAPAELPPPPAPCCANVLEENSRMTARAKVKCNTETPTLESRIKHLRTDRTSLAEAYWPNLTDRTGPGMPLFFSGPFASNKSILLGGVKERSNRVKMSRKL